MGLLKICSRSKSVKTAELRLNTKSKLRDHALNYKHKKIDLKIL